MCDEFKYDVAFSFLARDEPLATRLNDLLEGRLSTFLYSNRQKELAGSDGEERFTEVFGKEARLVVVLYRLGWGEKSWTGIEETAIRNRAFDHGYDFVVFIPLDEPPDVPKWLPRTQMWIGLKRWGEPSAASVIEARVQELGGEPGEESVGERAARVARSIEFSERRKAFLDSEEGVNAAMAEFERLKAYVQTEISSVSESTSAFNFSIKAENRQFAILGRGPALRVSWKCHFRNSLADSVLEATLWQGHPPMAIIAYPSPTLLGTQKFQFDLTSSNEYRWVSTDREGRVFASADLADHLLKYCIEQAGNHLGR